MRSRSRILTAGAWSLIIGLAALLAAAFPNCAGCGVPDPPPPACRPCAQCTAAETCASVSGGSRCCIPGGGNQAPSYDGGAHRLDLVAALFVATGRL